MEENNPQNWTPSPGPQGPGPSPQGHGTHDGEQSKETFLITKYLHLIYDYNTYPKFIICR